MRARSLGLRRHLGLRRDVVRTSRTLAGAGLVAGTTGNASVRAGRGVLITPARVPHGELRPWDVVEVTDGIARSGARRAPSRDLDLHLAIYAARGDVMAIVHTHSPYATAWSFTGHALTAGRLPGEPVLARTEELDHYGIGTVRTTAAARAGSSLLARRAVAALGAGRAVLLGKHGVVAVGGSLGDATHVAQAVEHQAQVAWLCAVMTARPRTSPAPGRWQIPDSSLYLAAGRLPARPLAKDEMR